MQALSEDIIVEIASLIDGKRFIEWILIHHRVLKGRDGKRWSDRVSKIIEKKRLESVKTLWKLVYFNASVSYHNYTEKYKIMNGITEMQSLVAERYIPSAFDCLIKMIDPMYSISGYIVKSNNNITLYYSEDIKGVKCSRFSLHMSMGYSFFGRMKDGIVDGIVVKKVNSYDRLQKKTNSYYDKVTVIDGKIKTVSPNCPRMYDIMPLTIEEKKAYKVHEIDETWCHR